MAEYRVNAGDMRTTITLQSPMIAKDPGAAQKPVYANVSTHPIIKARWVNAHGQESVQTAVKSVQRATVTIRHRDDILTPTRHTDWRVLRDGEPWNIISIDPIQDKNRWIELVVEHAKGSV